MFNKPLWLYTATTHQWTEFYQYVDYWRHLVLLDFIWNYQSKDYWATVKGWFNTKRLFDFFPQFTVECYFLLVYHKKSNPICGCKVLKFQRGMNTFTWHHESYQCNKSCWLLFCLIWKEHFRFVVFFVHLMLDLIHFRASEDTSKTSPGVKSKSWKRVYFVFCGRCADMHENHFYKTCIPVYFISNFPFLKLMYKLKLSLNMHYRLLRHRKWTFKIETVKTRMDASPNPRTCSSLPAFQNKTNKKLFLKPLSCL